MTPPPVINDRYEIVRRIGRGGMADVFLGRDRLLDRQVALKVLFPEFAVDPNFVERFRREAQAAANLNHPNIVNVFDWGKSGTTYFIAMEYVEGRTLADILRANGQLTSKQAAEIAGEVAAALGFAHAAGLVHRDIKPANILIGTNGSVKVADFGIARALNSPTEANLTQAGAVMGTATYFSPEQAQGAQPDPRSDLYSLGVVMYEMIAGRPPFTGENPVAIAYKQVHNYPTPLNKLVADVPRAFEAIVAKLLTKDPNVRYSTADAVREDLRRFRNGEVPVALLAAGAAHASNTAQTPTVVGPTNGANRPSQQLTAVQRTQAGGPRTQAGGPRTAQRPPTGSLPQVGYDEPPKRTGWYALAAFFAIIALGLGGFLLFRTLTSDTGEADSRALPNYVGWELQEVKDNLDARGLVPVPIAEESDAVEPGRVHRTEPGEGVVVARGSTVRVFYREIETTATIPDVLGRTEAAARSALEEAGFVNVTVQYEINDDEEDGTVIDVDPPVGETIQVTDEITLTVARASGETPATDGPTTTTNQVSVPMVIGQSESSARGALADAGLEADVTYFETRENRWIGNVMDQTPRRGATLQVGDTVELIVGVEPPEPTPTQPPRTNPQPTQPPRTNPPPPPTNPPPTQPPPTQATTTTTQAPTTTTTVPNEG